MELIGRTVIDTTETLESLPNKIDCEIDKAEAALAKGERYATEVKLVLTASVPKEFFRNGSYQRQIPSS
jgi:hypothetical protein